MNKIHTHFAYLDAMVAGMAIYGIPVSVVESSHRSLTDEEVKRKYGRPFRRKREDETDEEYAAAWHEYQRIAIAEDCAKKGLTVFEINGELIPARNEREAYKRYKNRHK